MEKILQIIGAKIVQNKMVELTLIPYTSQEVRQKHQSFLTMATKGLNVKDMVEEIQGHRQQISTLFISEDEWLNTFKNKIYSTIKVDMSLEKMMPDRV